EPPAAPPIVGDEMPPADPPAPRLAKNRAESRFQIGLLNEELAEAAQTRPADSAVPDAQKASAEAQSAYDRAEYTDAMRLALRGRRKLGTRIESLPPPNTRIPPTPPAMVPVALDGPAGTAPCIQCGRPLKAADRFCRSCGTPKAPTACPSCGTSIELGDRFCPACGVTIA
ncbi:MAG: zinc ribbon domain-containing protein, partial [Candidatus Lutacidiplasmatales archaeon]